MRDQSQWGGRAASRSPDSRSAQPWSAGGATPIANAGFYAALLSGIAGYVDAAGFVSLVGLFPAHLTGEIVGDAIALSSGHFAAHAHLWAFPTFIGAVIVATLVARLCRHRGFEARAGLLALLTLALALFSASDALAWMMHEGQLPLLIRGGFAVAAMGFQNALMRESLAGSCPTTVMTGNLTQVAIGVVDHVVGKLTKPLLREQAVRARLAPVIGALFVFAASAVLGGWLTRVVGSVSVALPAALSFALTFETWRRALRRKTALNQAARRAHPRAHATEEARDGLARVVDRAPTVEPWADVFPDELHRCNVPEEPVGRGSATRIKVGASVATTSDGTSSCAAPRVSARGRNVR